MLFTAIPSIGEHWRCAKRALVDMLCSNQMVLMRMAIPTEQSAPDALLKQLCRYSFVGAIAFAFDFGSLFILAHFLGVHYLAAAGIAFLIGLSVNYVLSIKWVFNRRSIGDKRIEFLLFVLIGLAGLGLNELFIWFFTETAHIHYLASKVVSTVFVYLWNFFARKYSLFR
jgi:putative flippase GtrA